MNTLYGVNSAGIDLTKQHPRLSMISNVLKNKTISTAQENEFLYIGFNYFSDLSWRKSQKNS